MKSELPLEGLGGRARLKNRSVYNPPKLVKYGTLQDLTLSAGNAGNSDNGTNPGHTKTH